MQPGKTGSIGEKAGALHLFSRRAAVRSSFHMEVGPLYAAGERTMKNFAIVRSDDAPTDISAEELSIYTERAIARMRQLGNSVPPILVVHVSESVAAAVGIRSTGIIRHNHSAVPDLSSYYEIWLVGRAAFAEYVLALQGIMDDFNSSNLYANGAPA